MSDSLKYRIYYERKLPHYQPEGAIFFITTRLKNSLPKSIVEKLRLEKIKANEELVKISEQKDYYQRWYEEQRRYFGKWDAALDNSPLSDNWLSNPRIAKIVQDSLHYFNGQRYELDAYCIMPNHVHIVLQPLEKSENVFYSLTSIMHSIKRFTAKEANKLLGRTGSFWQPETYDHIVRDDSELLRIILYVINNPVKAGLVDNWVDWDWTYTRFDV